MRSIFRGNHENQKKTWQHSLKYGMLSCGKKLKAFFAMR